jgi:dolichol-phosphate mannosyltransferase
MPTADSKETLVVIPTYNEAENIADILPAVLAALPCEVLVVDDDSPDGTAAQAQRMAESDARIHVICRKDRPRGLGPAYVDGFKFALDAGCQFIVQMDADFSHQPAALPVLRNAADYADLVIGSRWVPGGEASGWKLPRRMISKGGSWYARTVLGLPVQDVTSGFKCWRADALKSIQLDTIVSVGFAFQIEMNHRAHQSGLRIQEVPIRFSDRTRGASKMSMRIFLEGLASVWRIRRSKWR